MRSLKCLFLLTLLISSAAYAQNQHRPKVGLVLSGGAAKGIAHIGVLKVLKELGIHVDYVAGTSMGSIVGGFYAMGYDADSLEKFVLEQNWIKLLADEIPRSSYSVEEKEETQRYIASFPVERYVPKLPRGLKAGQNVSDLLTRYTLPFMNDTDFNTLPKPFFCVAVDIETGKEVVMRSGNLARCISASMAIPTVFAPVTIDNRLLVDGGIVNNFPVDHMKEMGADIIIGVNLGFKPYSKDELNSISAILEQALFLPANKRNKENEALCNILILPQLDSYSRADFNQASKLIALGEKAAREKYSELKALADSLAKFGPEPPVPAPRKIDTLKLDDIQVEGLVNVSFDFIRGKLRIKTPCLISVDNLSEAIDRIYGTQFFEKITWRIREVNGMNTLVITAAEKNEDLLRVGARYDSDFNANLLLNLIFRNKLIKGSKLSFDAILGQYKRFRLNYLVHTAWNNRGLGFFSNLTPFRLNMFPDVGLNLEYNSFDIYTYVNSERTASYSYRQTKFGIFGRSNLSNNITLGSAANIELSSMSPRIYAGPAIQDVVDYKLINLSAFFTIDSYDQGFYPKKGVQFFNTLEWINNLSPHSNALNNMWRFTSSFEVAAKITPHFAIIPAIYTGMVKSDSIPQEYLIFCGGLNQSKINSGMLPFVGRQFLEIYAKSMIIGAMNLRLEPAVNHFITIRGNVGFKAPSYQGIFQNNDFFTGYGLSYGYNSIVGPLELSWMRSDDVNKNLFYVSIGFWF